MGKKKYVTSNKYLTHLRAVMDSVYASHDNPILANYANAVAIKIYDDDKREFEENHPGKTYTCPQCEGKNIHKTVKRKILELVDSGEMIMMEVGKQTYIYPNNAQYRYDDFAANVAKFVTMGKDDLHQISCNTFAVAVQRECDADRLTELLTDFIGVKHCYSVVKVSDNLVLAMLCGYTDEESDGCIKKVSMAIKNAYVLQHTVEQKDPFAEARRKERERRRQLKAKQKPLPIQIEKNE